MNKTVVDGKWTGARERSERCCVLPGVDIIEVLAILINGRVDEEFEHLLEINQNKVWTSSIGDEYGHRSGDGESTRADHLATV